MKTSNESPIVEPSPKHERPQQYKVGDLAYTPRIDTWFDQGYLQPDPFLFPIHQVGDFRSVGSDPIATIRVDPRMGEFNAIKIIQLMIAAPKLWRMLRSVLPSLQSHADRAEKFGEVLGLLHECGDYPPIDYITPTHTDDESYAAWMKSGKRVQ